MESASGLHSEEQDEIQQMIQDRQVKIQEIKHAVEDSVKDFTALTSCIQRSLAELIDVIEQKQKTTEEQAEGFIKELQQEITELEKRCSELKQLPHTEDQLLQNFTSINTALPTKDWTKLNVHPSSCVETALRTAVAQLEKEMEKMLCDVELRRFQKYEVDVTLDPDTAHPSLILSEDGKQVSDGNVRKNLPDNTERFSYCVNVLGKQSFSSGRFYYEVQVGGKTDWDVGVARESINRKGPITLSPNDGYWTIWLRNGNEYKACADPVVLLPVREELQKVGVFVDYEEGLVSFYDVERRAHLYSFTGCTFTEKLYPFFCPGLNRNGTNSAPLIISAVSPAGRTGQTLWQKIWKRCY